MRVRVRVCVFVCLCVYMFVCACICVFVLWDGHRIDPLPCHACRRRRLRQDQLAWKIKGFASLTTNQNTHLGKKESPSRRLQCNESRKEAARLTPLLTPRTFARLATWNIMTMTCMRLENHPGSKRDEKLQDRNAGTEWDKGLQSGVLSFIWRTAAALRTHRGWSPPYSGCGPDAGARGTCGTHRLGSCQVPHHHSQVYHQEERHQAEHHPVLCSHQWCGGREERWLLPTTPSSIRQIGMENMSYEDIMGTRGLGQMNENGERFADLCASNQLVIGSSIFPRKRIHRATWISPNHVTENQIDHKCISRKLRRCTSWWEVLTYHQTTTFLWQQWNLASRDSPTPTAHGQSTVLDRWETRAPKQLSRSAFPTGSSRYKSW